LPWGRSLRVSGRPGWTASIVPARVSRPT
jgi:hypothetical protein